MYGIYYLITYVIFFEQALVLLNNNIFHEDGCLFVGLRLQRGYDRRINCINDSINFAFTISITLNPTCLLFGYRYFKRFG